MSGHVKTVSEIVEMARSYIQESFADDPGFQGAYLIGSINHMAPEDPFPDYRDVDIGVVTGSVEDRANSERNVNGYIVEVIRCNPRLFKSAEMILSDCLHADNFAADSILLDPGKFLVGLNRQVQDEFSRRKWVRARCENELKSVAANLQGMKDASGLSDFMVNFGRFVMYTTGALTAVHLQPPTHRRGPLQLRNILKDAGQDALYTKYLQTAGVFEVSKSQAEQFLTDAVTAFDLAIEVFKTPIPYAYKLEPFIRPYLLEGTKEVFREGGYREAIFWIARFYVIAAMVIQTDGSKAEQDEAGIKLLQFLQALGIATDQGRVSRTRDCEDFYHQVSNYIDERLVNAPLLID